MPEENGSNNQFPSFKYDYALLPPETNSSNLMGIDQRVFDGL